MNLSAKLARGGSTVLILKTSLRKGAALALLGAVVNSLSVAPAQADAFVELASTNSPRFHPTATLLANRQVLLAKGGGNPIFEEVASAEIYDPTTHAWSLVGGFNFHDKDGSATSELYDPTRVVARAFAVTEPTKLPAAGFDSRLTTRRA